MGDPTLRERIKEGLETHPREVVIEGLKRMPFYQEAKEKGISDEELMTHPDILETFRQHAADNDWSLGDAIADSTTLGLWKYFKAAQASDAAAVNGKSDLDVYAKEVKRLEMGKAAWEHLNPGKAIAIDIGGAAVPLGGSLKVASMGVRMLPRIGRYLAGEGGVTRMGRAISTGVGAMLSGAEGGAIGSGMHPETPIGDQMLTGAAAGGALSPLPSLINPLLTRGINALSAGRAAVARRLGIDLTPKQLYDSGAKPVSPGKSLSQLRQYQRALFRTMGHDADSFTQDNFRAARQGIGRRRDELLPHLAIDPDPTRNPSLYNRLADLENQAQSSSSNPGNDPSVQRILGVIHQIRTNLMHSHFRGRPGMPGMMSGEEYAHMTHKNGLIDRLRSDTDGTIRHWGNQLRDIMDESVSSNNPAAKAAWDQNSREYRAWVALKRPAANAQLTGGNITPGQVANAVKTKYPDFSSTGTPGSDLGDVVTAGSYLRQRPTATGGTEQPVTGNRLMRAVNRVGPVAGLTAGAGELLPGLADTFGNGLTTSAIFAGAGLAGGYVGSKAVKAASETPGYRDAIVNRLISPRDYQGVPTGLVAPAVAGGEMNSQVGSQLVLGGSQADQAQQAQDVSLARQLELLPAETGATTEPHITLTRPGG